MNKQLLEENKAKLLDEQKRIKTILDRATVPDSEIPGGHRPKYDEVGTRESESAHESEQFGNDLSVTEDLDARLKKVEAALQRIADNTYGKCMVGGEEIAEARLHAEPAAETCVQHAK